MQMISVCYYLLFGSNWEALGQKTKLNLKKVIKWLNIIKIYFFKNYFDFPVNFFFFLNAGKLKGSLA